MAPVSVVVADAQRLFAESLGRVLATRAGVTVLDLAATNGSEAVEAVIRHRPDVAVFDYWMTGMNAAAATRQLLARDRDARVLIVASMFGPVQVAEAASAGAAGFLSKSAGFATLVAAIEAVHAGSHDFPGQELGARPAPSSRDRAVVLTKREVEVLQLFCEGRSRQQVASELGLAPGTVKNHVQSILAKTGARSVVQAVHVGRLQGLVRETGTGRR